MGREGITLPSPFSLTLCRSLSFPPFIFFPVISQYSPSNESQPHLHLHPHRLPLLLQSHSHSHPRHSSTLPIHHSHVPWEPRLSASITTSSSASPSASTGKAKHDPDSVTQSLTHPLGHSITQPLTPRRYNSEYVPRIGRIN